MHRTCLHSGPLPHQSLPGHTSPARATAFSRHCYWPAYCSRSFSSGCCWPISSWKDCPGWTRGCGSTRFRCGVPDRAGAQAAIVGSLWLMFFTAMFCLPTGIMAAIYLEEYADDTKWFNRFIELNVQNLAAVPSVVFGILGLGILARQIGFGPTLPPRRGHVAMRRLFSPSAPPRRPWR